MRYSDGAIVPGNARIDAAETADRIRRFWRPYREAIAETAERMTATGEPPAIVSVHSFTPVWRGLRRIWKVGLLWDRDPRLSGPLVSALSREPDLLKHEVGDNEPYDGALVGDTIDATATAHGLSNTLIEVRQDLIATRAGAEGWADRLARLLKPILAEPRNRAPEDWGSRAQSKIGGREAR
jgi:predicted N-formylglutamate amidohydrolase